MMPARITNVVAVLFKPFSPRVCCTLQNDSSLIG
jgi:hypothetical protein